jgi:hypothetical protein
MFCCKEDIQNIEIFGLEGHAHFSKDVSGGTSTTCKLRQSTKGRWTSTPTMSGDLRTKWLGMTDPLSSPREVTVENK